MQDDKSTESAYQDLAIDPEALTHWSIAQALPAGNREDPRCHTTSPRPHNSPQVSVASRSTRSRTATARKPKAPLQRGKALSAAEIHALVKSKERIRRQRRAQKVRGDWLGVTGADPQLGEYPVLTPTDSPSSDTTAPSDAKRMAKLAEEEKQAKKVYDMARHRKEEERERLELEKARSRLGKIERLKKGQNLHHQPEQWIPSRGHWASVAEPGLSTIAQSSASYEEIRNTPGYGTVPAPAAASASTSVSAQENDDHAETILPNLPYSGESNALGILPSSRHVSTGTIIHTPAPGRPDHHIALAERAPKSQHGPKCDLEPERSAQIPSGRHFLWARRRRVTDPGGQVPKGEATVSLSTRMEPRATLLSPDLESGRRKDGSTDLIIPDYHLGPMHLEKGQEIRRLLRETTSPPLPTAKNTPAYGVCKEGRPASRNIPGKGQETPPYSQGGAPVTVTSSQLKLNGSTIHLAGTLTSVAEPMNGNGVTREGCMGQARLHQSPTVSCRDNTPRDDRIPDMMEQDSRVVVSKPRKEVDEEKPRRCLSVERRSEMIEAIKVQGVPNGPGSACTPITITSGCAVSLLIRPMPQALLKPTNEQGDRCTTPMGARAGTMKPGVCSASSSLSGQDRLLLVAPAPKGELKEAQNQSTSDPDARTRPSSSRRPRPDHNGASTLSRRTAKKADGSLGPKITQTSTAAALGPKAPPPPSRAPPPVPIPAGQCTTTGQKAARTAMLHSRAREVTDSWTTGSRTRRWQYASPGPAKNEGQEPHAGGAVGTGAHSQPAGTGKPVLAALAPPPTRDTVAVLGAVGAFATCGVWAAAWGWWVVVQPAFDGSSSLWARRSRQQSTWVDMAIFTLAGVSCLFGVVVGLHAFQVLWWLVRL